MGFHCSGTVSIPSEEFWEWIQKECSCNHIFNPEKTFINTGSQDLVLSTDSKEIWIELVALWQFVSSYTPDLRPAEWRFGIPRLDLFYLEIDFCANTESVEGCVDPRFIEILGQWKNSHQEQYIFKK
jgi:hypothetical protein